MKICFESEAFKDFYDWAATDKKNYKKIFKLIKEILRAPSIDHLNGEGQPEALKHELSGCYSRRIDQEHRLVYTDIEGVLVILSCKFHYQ